MSEIYLSYAWGGESEQVADEIEQALAAHHIRLRRDKRELGAKDSIREFMAKIGHGRAVVLLISDKYLRSRFCMSELLQVFAHGDFKQRIFLLVLSDARIYDAIDLLDYIKHWEDKKKELEVKMRSVGLANLQGIGEDLNLYDDIRDMIARIVDILRDMIVLSPLELRESGYAKLIELAEGVPAAAVSTALLDPVSDSPPAATQPASPFQVRVRPASPGASLGHYRGGATTFGALVTDRGNPKALAILSDLTPFCAGGTLPNPGDAVIQPARPDGGTRADIVAKVSRFIVAHDQPARAASNLIALIAAVRKVTDVSAKISGLGVPRGVRPAVDGEAVSMVGRTSGAVHGEVLQIDAQIELPLPVCCVGGPLRGTGDGNTVPIVFGDLIETTPMLEPGDCGALLIAADGYAIAMAFAGSGETSFFFPLQRALDALAVDLVTG